MVYIISGLIVVAAVVGFMVYMGIKKEDVEGYPSRNSSTDFLETFNVILLVLNAVGSIFLSYTLSNTVTITNDFEVVTELNILMMVVVAVMTIAFSVFIYLVVQLLIDQKEISLELQIQNQKIIDALDK